MSTTENSKGQVVSCDDIYALLEKHSDAKRRNPTPAVSWIQFGATVVLGIPFLTMLLPLSISWQLLVAVKRLFVGQRKMMAALEGFLAPIDSGIPCPPTTTITPLTSRKYDVVVLGATGFTGRLVVEHLLKKYGSDISWAIAGRSKQKLDAVKESVIATLNPHDPSEMNGIDGGALTKVLRNDVDVLIVDTTKPETIPLLVEGTKCVITTAGPFEQYGSPVVEGCVKYGTHYVDITGEVDWVNTMQLTWEQLAQETGAKIVSLCGCDSIPWDISTQQLEKMLVDNGETLVSVEFWDELSGEASGGTCATMLNIMKSRTRGPPIHFDDTGKKIDLNNRLPNGKLSEAQTVAKLDILPTRITNYRGSSRCFYKHFFPLALGNSRVVERSNALRGLSNNLVYREGEVVPDWKSSASTVISLALFFVMTMNPLTCWFLQRFILPAPGQGSSRLKMHRNFYLLVTGKGTGSKGTVVQSTLYFDQCAGYLNTGRMVAESGLSLALTPPPKLESTDKGGFFTPSTAMGATLLHRLQKCGAMHFAVEKISKDA